MDVVRIGQDFLSQFNSAQQISFHNNFYDKSFTLQDLKDFGIKVDSELGSEVEVIDEIIDNKIWKGKQYYGYVRYSKYSKTHRPIKTIFAFDSNKTIYRFEITQIPDPVPSNFENYSTKTALRLPFEGAWYVASGGRSSMYNHHTELLATRYATDFIIKKGESYFSGTGRRNEDYFSFNQKVLAPGSGVIVYVENDINENKIGYKLPENAGNRVTINHENESFHFFAILRKDLFLLN